MFCSKCGKQLNDDAKFCNNCGASVGVGNTQQNTYQTNNTQSWQSQVNNMQNIQAHQFNNQLPTYDIKIKGFKGVFRDIVNKQFNYIRLALLLAIFVFYYLGEIFWFGLLLEFIAAISFIIINLLNRKTVFIDTNKGIIYLNRKAMFDFIKKQANISDIKEVRIEKFKVGIKNAKNPHDFLFGCGKFDNVSLIDNNGKRILSVQFFKNGNSEEYINALGNMAQVLNRYDIVFNTDNELKNDLKLLS